MKHLWKIIYFLRVFVLSDILVYRTEEFTTYKTWKHQSRKLFCTSDNFNDALTWNPNLDWVDLRMPKEEIHKNSYAGTYKDAKSEIDCNFVDNESCLYKWKVTNSSSWTFISTSKKPMSPVFDRRWENFREYGNLSEDNYWLMDVEKFENKGTLIFSVRGSKDVHLLLCSGDDYVKESCFAIIIGGWFNKKSAIRNCQTGVPIPPHFSTSCPTLKEKHHNPLSSSEWRTFILSWNFTNTSDISVKDIVTSGSIQNYTFRMDIKGNGHTGKNNYYLFYRTMKPILFRFHIYNYFQTNKEDDELVGPVFETQKNFCIQMTIGLCDDCKMIISLVDIYVNSIFMSRELESITTTFHKLPTWQNVKWNVTLPHNITKVQLTINTKLEKYNSNPLWAVATIQECLPADFLKTTAITASQDYINDYYHWPNVTCQKLSYNGTTIVSSISEVSSTINLNDELCPEGKIGQGCAMKCRNLMDKNENCAGIVVCNKQGCMCPQGFVGRTCNTPCSFGGYGFGCNQSCGRCSQNSPCNFLTGECHLGCDKTGKYYVKPFCKIGIDIPPPPEIKFLNETYVKVSLPILEEYRKVGANLVFTIWENHLEIILPRSRNFDNSQNFEAEKNDLKAGISYQVQGILHVGSSDLIFGEMRTFTTPCTATSNFQIHDIKNTSFILRKFNDSYYSCPEKSYHVLVKTNVDTIFFVNVSYPHEFKNLAPFTTYNVSITRDQDNIYFSQSFRTLISAPSKVRSLEVISISQREVILRWRKPEKEHGNLEGYEISVQPLEFHGCFNKSLPPTEKIRYYTSTNENIYIQNLHPYTKYNFKISARIGDNLNTITGSPIGINFTTKYTEIPTAVFSNLRLIRDKLSWDPPKNCFTISGPFQLAKLVFTSSSKYLLTYQDIRETSNYYFVLGSQNQTIYGAEHYFVNLYIARINNENVNINLSNYQRLEFLAPPKAPPPVRNFEIYEIETKALTTSVRWQPPNPPTNGEIIFYSLGFCSSKCQFLKTKIMPNETCELWNGYICATLKQPTEIFTHIKIFALNKNVYEVGEPVSIINDKIEKAPDAPSNISVELFPKGIVKLSWSHPWKSGGPIEKFLIHIKLNSTKLKNVPSSFSKPEILQEHVLSKYNSIYSTKLFLLSSSEYKISVQAITFGKSLGGFKNVRVRTPSSIAFAEEFQTKAQNDNSTISIILPEILNNTINNIIYIIVKGPTHCENYSVPDESIKKIANIKYYEISWCAASFPSENYTKREFSIGDNKTYIGGQNCVLYPENSYVVFIVLKTNDGKIIVTQSKSILLGKPQRVLYEVWLILPFVLILVPVLLYFFYFRRKKAESKLSLECEKVEHINNNLKNIQMEIVQKIPQIETSPKMQKSVENVCPDSKKLKTDDKKSKLIEVKDFEDYVKQALNSGELDQQFEDMPKGLTKSTVYGKLADNKKKNRYANLITYDENRVILETLPDDPSSDYINASYVKNTTKDRFYIATQGPKPNTVIDFWRMVWQEKVSVICMLTNIIEKDKAKCEQYWPEFSKRTKYGDVIVENVEETVLNYYTIRLMEITRSNETQKITHLHYTAWPDHGIPLHTYSVVSFMQKMSTISTEQNPVIVHCSAGIGRTGTIILLDICLHQAANKGAIGVQKEFEEIRKQRYLIENEQQYLFVHLILVEYFFSLSTNIPCGEDLSTRIEEMKKKINIHEERLKEISWRGEILQPFVSKRPLSVKNLAKNRFPHLASGTGNRVYLKRYPVSDEDSDYISAVYVDGVKQKNQYLATQLPLPSTLSDFWRMIAELKVEIIIMLQPPDTEDPTCCEFIPNEKELFKPVEYLNISLKSEDITNSYKLKTIELIDYSERETRQQSIILISCSEWKLGKNEELPKPETLVALWQTVNKVLKGEVPVVTICYDGVTGCGLYLALSFLLERMNSEGECDVISAIRAIRKSRPDFVQSTQHIEFLYAAALSSVR